ncbi:MAG: hypothetical protein HC887_11435 [Desulfobacteraceae bacterium]|nr:hypothetical protein [Desulfobacteraceae bacterium]
MKFHANNPELDNKNVSELQDSKGKYVIKDYIRIVAAMNQGFSEQYWKNPAMAKSLFSGILMSGFSNRSI